MDNSLDSTAQTGKGNKGRKGRRAAAVDARERKAASGGGREACVRALFSDSITRCVQTGCSSRWTSQAGISPCALSACFLAAPRAQPQTQRGLSSSGGVGVRDVLCALRAIVRPSSCWPVGVWSACLIAVAPLRASLVGRCALVRSPISSAPILTAPHRPARQTHTHAHTQATQRHTHTHTDQRAATATTHTTANARPVNTDAPQLQQDRHSSRPSPTAASPSNKASQRGKQGSLHTM